MNSNSLICNFINNNPNNWRDLLTEKGIKIKEENGLAIFNYDIGVNFSDPIVQEARGIIIYIDTLDVACFPFRKFGNYEESYADEIDWASAHVQEKIDGSIMKVWWNKLTNEWQISTNATINATNASCKSGISFRELFTLAINYKDIKFSDLDKENTYIFELVSPSNVIVINYDNTMLYHIGTRNNISGKEFDIDIGIIKPKLYNAHNLNECINKVKNLNISGTDVNDVTHEGFVVVDKDYHRVKIKSPEYLMIHGITSTDASSKKYIIELLRDEKIDILSICTKRKNVAHIIKYYDYKWSELQYKITCMILYSRSIYNEYGQDRKILAKAIKSHRLSSFGFKAVSNDLTPEEIIKSTETRMILKLIPDYEKEYMMKSFYDNLRGDENE